MSRNSTKNHVANLLKIKAAIALATIGARATADAATIVMVSDVSFSNSGVLNNASPPASAMNVTGRPLASHTFNSGLGTITQWSGNAQGTIDWGLNVNWSGASSWDWHFFSTLKNNLQGSVGGVPNSHGQQDPAVSDPDHPLIDSATQPFSWTWTTPTPPSVNTSAWTLDYSSDFGGQHMFGINGIVNMSADFTLTDTITYTPPSTIGPTDPGSVLDDVTFTSSCENIHYTGDLIVGNSSSATLNQDCGTFTVDGDVILGNLATGAGTYNLGGTAVLTVGGDLVVGKSGSGVFNQSGGSVTVDGTLLIAANAGANGTYNLTGGTLNAPTVVNNGSFNFTGGTANINSITGTGATTVGNGRTLQVNHVRQSTLNVNGTVRINPNGSASGVSKLNNLNVASSGSLDLKDNDLVVDYAGTTPLGTFNGTAYTGLSGKIASAYDFGAWDGFGITTSMPDAQAGLTTLGIGEASEILTLSGTDTDLWGGQTVDATSVLIRYTYAGDVNLDGVIDGGDYGILDNYVAIPGASGYAHGDVNYDGVIDGGDYAIVDNNIQAQGAPLTTSGAMGVTGVTAVPEPASIGVLVGMAGALALRRRR